MFRSDIMFIVPRASRCKSLLALSFYDTKRGESKLSKKNPKADKAYEMYKLGMRLVDIAKELDVPDGTVRRWKNAYEWEHTQKNKKKQSERSEGKSERSLELKDASRLTRKKDGTEDTLKNDELTPEQQIFCILYARTFNATQSYLKAYKCSYETAMVEGCRNLRKPKIKKEIESLKEIKMQQVLCGVEDLIELNMRIAFADIGDYVEFGQKEEIIRTKDGPLLMTDRETGKQIPATRKINVVDLKESNVTDTQIIQSITEGKNGISIRLADKNKAMEWLDKFFVMNPMDKHKQEFDRKKLEIELLKLDAAVKHDGEEPATNNNLIDALNASESEVWKNE